MRSGTKSRFCALSCIVTCKKTSRWMIRVFNKASPLSNYGKVLYLVFNTCIVFHINLRTFAINYYCNHFTAFWTLSGTTRVSRYQKKHSPTHTYRGHQLSLICFLHLLRSMASSRIITNASATDTTWSSYIVTFCRKLGPVIN